MAALQQCSACHAAANEGPTGWLGSLAVGHGDAPSQSAACMECHGKDFSRQASHGRPIICRRNASDDHWRTRRRRIRTTYCCERSTRYSLDIPRTSLRRLPSRASRCRPQSRDDRQRQLPSLPSRAVPELRGRSSRDFGGWPYERRTRIVFDHVAHQAKHFADKKQPFDCRTCHVDDATHSVQLLTSYDRACAACHDDKIRTSIGRGVPMLALPTLDVNAFRKAGLDVGPWPAAATGDFDGRMPPR